MRNWLGQEIVPGAVVYRGARDGNSSSYKVGVVESVKAGKARVAWKYSLGYRYRRPEYLRDAPSNMDSHGSPDINSLIRLDESVLTRLEQLAALADQWVNFQLSAEDYASARDSLPDI